MSRCVRPNGKPMEQRGPIQPMSREDELFWDWRHGLGRPNATGFRWFKNWRERRAGRV